MMNIYDGAEGATLDIGKAGRELRSSGAITNDGVRRAAIAEIQTAALLDIALSLRVMAAEARAAMPSGVDDGANDEPTEPSGDFLVVGDFVVTGGGGDSGEVVSFGQSEGATYADVRFGDGDVARAWLDTLTRVDPTPSPDAIVDFAKAETMAEPEPADLVDDIDKDFDGDEHPAAASALDVLKANEAERKAAKKKGGKS